MIAGRRKEPLDATVKQATDAGGQMRSMVAGVSDSDVVKRLFAEVKQSFGRLDVLFNNAGRGAPGVPLEDLTPEQWLSVVGVNLNGSFYCTQEAIKIMKDQDPRGGRIINNGSISAHAPRPNSAPYTPTKHAITGLTKAPSLHRRKYTIARSHIHIGHPMTAITPS